MPDSDDEATPPDEPTGQGWRESLRPTFPRILVAVLLAALAFTMTVQIRQDEGDDYTTARGAELVELLKGLDAANQRLSTQINSLTATRDDLLTSTRRSADAQKQARDRAEQLSILAGTSGATGPGIELTIEDPDKAIDAASLLYAVEELRSAGAEAIVVNGTARVVAQTYFLDDDDAVRIAGREVTRPFVIEAIGDPAILASAMRFLGGLTDRVNNRGGTVSVEERDRVTITALADLKSPEYARPTS